MRSGASPMPWAMRVTWISKWICLIKLYDDRLGPRGEARIPAYCAAIKQRRTVAQKKVVKVLANCKRGYPLNIRDFLEKLGFKSKGELPLHAIPVSKGVQEYQRQVGRLPDI